MPKPSAQVTAADISRLAGVTRATVSNWRRRHADFPAPSGGTDASPLYDLAAVQGWLAARGHTAAASAAEELRAALRLRGPGAATRALPLVLAAAERDPSDLTKLAELPPAGLVERAHAAVADLAGTVPGVDAVGYDERDADVLRALLRCVRDEGGPAALDVLAERELDDSKASGAYATPAPLADLMARLLAPAAGPAPAPGGRSPGGYPARVLDPACGSGSLLAAAAAQGAAELFGQDTLAVQAQRTAVRLRLTAPAAAVTARVGDSLRDDAFPGLAADAALSNPPYGTRDWGHDELAYDPRWAYGVPPRAESELAWVQHTLAHLAPGGLAVLLLPPATASRASGRRVRTELLRAGALRAVLALPPGAAIPLHIALHLWILQRPDGTGAEPQTVLFTDLTDAADAAPEASGDAAAERPTAARAKGGPGPADWTALTDTALDTWQRFRADPAAFPDTPGTARAVPVIDLLDDLVDLTPARHVRTGPATAAPDDMAHRAREDADRLRRALAALAGAGDLGDWPPSGAEPRTWRTATVADLARGGALTVLRAVPAARDADRPEPPAQPPDADRPVLTGRDVATGARASRPAGEEHLAHPVLVEEGDVLLPRVAAARGGGSPARVADRQDAGSLLGSGLILFRPDRERLDPWFLAGFLAAEDNVSAATTGSLRSHIQIDPKRLRVPLLTLTEQRRYGDAFRRLHALRTAARKAADLAGGTAELLTSGLTSGTLLPPEPPPGPGTPPGTADGAADDTAGAPAPARRVARKRRPA